MFENIEREPVKYFPKYEPLEESVGKVIENINSRTGKPEFETGLEVLDRGIFGLHRKEMVILAARPGNGKSALACQIGYNIADAGHKVAIISLEMAKESILERMFAMSHEEDLNALMMGIKTERTLAKFEVFKNTLAGMKLRIIDDYCFTEDELYTLIDHLEFRPDVLILDHIQQIRIASSRLNERETMNNYLRFLKQLAMRHNISVLCCSQINRSGDESPTIASLKGTGYLEEIADYVLLMQLIKDKSDPYAKVMKCGLDIAKNRRGFCGYRTLEFEGRFCKFRNELGFGHQE